MARRVVEMYELPKRIDTEFFDSLPEEERFGRLGIWELAYRDLRNHEVTLAEEADLWQLTFNEETIFPEAYRTTAKNVLENGKGGRIQNRYGLTGKGVKVAVIDKPLQPEHPEFASKLTLIEVEPGDERNQYIDFHGMTCASLLAGKTCGAAPDAELVYFMIPNTGDRKELSKYALMALQKIVEYNTEHSTEPIRLVSWSGGFVQEDMEERNRLVATLDGMGCYEVDATMFMRDYGGLEYHPYARAGESRYTLSTWQLQNLERNKLRPGFADWFNSCCYVPATACTCASEDIQGGFIHWGKTVSESWTIPQLVGAMATLLQKDASVTYAEFTRLAKGCPRKDGYVVLDMDWVIENL